MPEPGPRRMGEGVFALILTAFMLWLLYESVSISGFRSLDAPGVLPMAASFVGLVVIVAVTVSTFRKPPAVRATGEGARQLFRRTMVPRALPLVVLAILLYGLALEPLGFLIASALFLFAVIWLLQGGRPLRAAAITIASVAVIQITFRYGFEVLLPPGSFFQ